MQKEFQLAVDIEKKILTPSFEVNTLDLKTIKLKITITKGMTLVDLTGITVRMSIRKPDGNVIFQDCQVTNAKGGQVEIVLENQAYVMPGSYSAEIMCFKGADKVAVTGSFSYRSIRGIMDDKAVESKSEFTAITGMIKDTQETIEDLRKNGTGIDAQARQEVEQVSNQLKDTERHKIQWINVTKFGIDNTGTKNISDDLNRLIQTNNFSTLYFPDGVYNIDKTILLNNYCNFKLDTNAVLKAVSPIDHLVYIHRTKELTKQFITGGIIDGNGLAKTAIHARYFANLEMYSMVVKNAIEKNIYFAGGYEMYLNNIRVDNEVAYDINPNVIGIQVDCTDSVISNIIVKNNTVGVVNNASSNEFYSIHVWVNRVDGQDVRRPFTVGMISNAMLKVTNFYADSCATGVKIIGHYTAQLFYAKFLYPQGYEDVMETPLFIDNTEGTVYCYNTGFSSFGQNVRIATRMNALKIINSTFSTPFNTVSPYRNIMPYYNKFYRVNLSNFTMAAGTTKTIRIPINGISYLDFCYINVVNLPINDVSYTHYLYDNQLNVVFHNRGTANISFTGAKINAEVIPVSENNIVLNNIDFTVV